MSLNQTSNNRSGSRKRRYQSGAMGRKNDIHPNSITSQARAQSNKSATTSSSKSAKHNKERKSKATFVGDSTTTLELDAPMELVQEFLQSDSSNMYLLGTDDIKCHTNCQEAADDDENQLFECKQPILEFMGLKLQPIFQHKLHRNTPNQVTASIEEGSKAEILQHSKHPAKRVISGLVNEATFVGESVDQKCKLSIALSLTLQIPMPRFIPIPPGFNAIGSAIVRRTGRLRTQQLLERLKAAYYQHQQEQQEQQLHVAPTTTTKFPSVSSFEENFRRLLAYA
ncbi:MAG: hypothetical protein SGBAC_007850 [Bacillariaceae sp.]